MCTTYYTTQSCMAENQPELQRTHRKTGQSKFDQVYSAINQSYAKIYTTINERFSPKKEDEKESDEGNSDTSSSFDDLMPMYDLKDLEIGPYYLQRETDALKSHLNSRELRQFTKKERKWERIMGQATGRPHEQTHEESIFYTEEDLCLKHYALSHPRTFPQLLHEGPPMQYRWSVWKLLLKPHRFYVDGLYEKLRTLPTTSEVQIKKDLHRTFPEEKYFASKKYNKIGQKQLENVLRAISLYFTNTGYVQGMNFLAGLLLLISGGDELESFWMLVALARDPKFMFMGLFEKDFPLLNFYVSMFYQVLEVEAPVLYHHMKKNQLPIDLWLFKWFLTIFVPTLPSKDVVRIWDLILRQGFLGIIKVAVGIVKFYDKEIMHQDAIGMNLMFQSIMEDHIQKECQENVNILNTLNPLINMIFGRNKDKNSSPNSKPANVRCSFREFDVREVLEFAYEIDLDLENLRDLITVYENNSGEKLQEPYRKIMSNLSSPQSTVRRFKEFQNEIDYYIMRNALRDSERMGSGLNDATEA